MLYSGTGYSFGPFTDYSEAVQVSIMVAEHREEVGRLQEYIQGSY